MPLYSSAREKIYLQSAVMANDIVESCVNQIVKCPLLQNGLLSFVQIISFRNDKENKTKLERNNRKQPYYERAAEIFDQEYTGFVFEAVEDQPGKKLLL